MAKIPGVRSWLARHEWTHSCISHDAARQSEQFNTARALSKRGETAMENTIGFAGVAGAIFVSFAVALGLEWASLVLLMKMMPARPTSPMVAQRVSAVSQARPHRQAA
jgi:hypothetical protein